MINNYDSEMIYTPETNKMVTVGGNVGKKVLGGYKQMVGGSHDDTRKPKSKLVVQLATDAAKAVQSSVKAAINGKTNQNEIIKSTKTQK